LTAARCCGLVAGRPAGRRNPADEQLASGAHAGARGAGCQHSHPVAAPAPQLFFEAESFRELQCS